MRERKRLLTRALASGLVVAHPFIAAVATLRAAASAGDSARKSDRAYSLARSWITPPPRNRRELRLGRGRAGRSARDRCGLPAGAGRVSSARSTPVPACVSDVLAGQRADGHR